MICIYNILMLYIYMLYIYIYAHPRGRGRVVSVPRTRRCDVLKGMACHGGVTIYIYIHIYIYTEIYIYNVAAFVFASCVLGPSVYI